MEDKKVKKPREKRKVVNLSKMKEAVLYRGVDDYELYRKVNGSLERFLGGKWIDQKVNYCFLDGKLFKEY